jgi:signal transduction histidine kinase
MASPQSESGAVRVVLVDDDEDDFVLTRDLLAEISGTRYALNWIADYEKGLVAVCSGEHDVVLLDYKLGTKSGLDLLTEARRLGCDAPVIILTGMSDAEIDVSAMQRGAADYLEKSRLDTTILDRAIRYAIQQKQVESDLERRVKQRTDELDRAVAALQESGRRKDEFLATLAHELRNPLAPICNALEIMRLSDNQPDAIDMARTLMERQVAQLVRLIDDLLDISRITHGKLRLTRDRLQLAEILEAAIEQSRPLLDKAGQTLTLKLPTEDIWLTGDRVRLAQVFTNLLNNAAKYSDLGGRVTVVAARDGQQLTVRVADTGVGIPPEMLPHLFDQFSQVDRTLNRAQGGLGIGLNLVRRLVELHDGSIEATSGGNGHGSEFVVHLPCESL